MKVFTPLFIVILLLSAPGTWSQTREAQTTNPSTSATSAPQLSVCYNKEFPPISFAPFSLVTVDTSYPAISLEILRKSGKTVFCHLSLAKVTPNQGWFKPLAEAGALKKASPESEAQSINLDNPAWKNLLIQALIPQLIKKGFNGLYLDDLDLIYQQTQHGRAAALISDIRKQFPQLKLIANGGLKFLPAIAPHIDHILLENRFANQQKLIPLHQLTDTLSLLEAGKKANPKLTAFALDYFAPNLTSLSTQNLIFIATLRKLHWDYDLSSCVTVESLDAVPIRPLN